MIDGACFTQFMVLCISLLIIATIIIAIMIVRFNMKHKAQMAELEKYEINLNTSAYSNIPDVLDKFIEECFDEYKLIKLPPNSIDGSLEYVTDEKEAEIRTDLAEIVSSRLSNIILDRLSLYYKIEKIGEIIANKIYILVMTYAIQTRLTRDVKSIRNDLTLDDKK